jgi:hypothetical protein
MATTALRTAPDTAALTAASAIGEPFPAGRLVGLELSDAVAHGIAVDVLEGLEKYHWMLCAHAR